jgi:hypothetical protein
MFTSLTLKTAGHYSLRMGDYCAMTGKINYQNGVVIIYNTTIKMSRILFSGNNVF